MKNNIQIECVRISGFRGIRNMEISLPRIAVLIGPNNSGKTSVLKALQLALGNYAQYISEEDFFIDQKDNRIEKIVIDIKIVPYKDNTTSKNFNDEWGALFGDKIKKEGDQEFVAIRTIAEPDEAKGGFKCQRYVMQKWSDFSFWLEEDPKEKDKMRSQLPGMSFISLESQRDIFYELRDKSSFAGKILADIKYDKSSTEKLESEIEKINQEAVEKSEDLKNFKDYLKRLRSMFYGSSDVLISPLPKKLRDLSKHFSIHFGRKDASVFSMEYHGAGTRSWASILTTLAFINSRAKKHKEEGEPFFPFLSAEEPEAHLHPNAQKTLYRQIANFESQAIITTHSPYLSATADISALRSLSHFDNKVLAKTPSKHLSLKEVKKINREIIYKRGELLFAKAWILFEGITEEQLIPAMLELKEGKTAFDLGISCIGVNGKNYLGFLKLAYNMGIPVHIISDSDGSSKKEVESQIDKLKKWVESIAKEELEKANTEYNETQAEYNAKRPEYNQNFDKADQELDKAFSEDDKVKIDKANSQYEKRDKEWDEGISKRDKGERQFQKAQSDTMKKLNEIDHLIGASFLKGENDFEMELLNELNLKDEIIKALILVETNESENQKYKQAKRKEMERLSEKDILKKMQSKNNKASYSSFLADIIKENPNEKKPRDIIPKAVWQCFNRILERIK